MAEWTKHLPEIANYARSNTKNRAGLLVIRPGQLTVPPNAQAAELRCEYFKADRLVKCLLPGEDGGKRPKFLTSIVDEADANAVAKALLAANDAGQPQYLCQTLKPEKRKGDLPDILFLGEGKSDIPGTWSEVKMGKKKEKEAEASGAEEAEKEAGKEALAAKEAESDSGSQLPQSYFVWLHEGDQAMSNLMSGLLVCAFILITCFPLWPNFLKLWLWYLSCTLLVLIFSVVLSRWFLFLFIWIFGYEFWILPNLFDEERSVADSFKPLSSFEKTGPGQMWWRLLVLGGFIGFCFWAYSQPTEFDDFLKSNRAFVDDLYDGNLISDASQYSRDNIDNPYKIPSIDELLSDLEHDPSASAANAEDEERVENANFLEDEDEDANVDAMLDSLFEDGDSE